MTILPSTDPDAALLSKVEDFLKRTPRVSQTAFGLLVNGDGALVANLREGRSVRLRLANRILKVIAESDAESEALNSAGAGGESPDSSGGSIGRVAVA